ncbi:hypothetical protein, partial [Escherichia coli]|uniref:hypothetical protein n=1 Tax=Escherichia coli TaxID=562 RepID=UPI0019807F23
GLFLRTAVNDFMDSVHHIWCPLFSQEFQDLPDGAETTLTINSELIQIKSHQTRFERLQIQHYEIHHP